MPEAEIDRLLHWLKPVVDVVAATVGEHCEVVLHDLRHPATSVIYVANGHVTNRCVGQGIRDLMAVVHSPDFRDDTLVNYALALPLDGKTVRSSTVLFRDEAGTPVAALCINVDVSGFIAARDVLDRLARVERTLAAAEPATPRSDVAAVVERLVESTVESYGKPVADMNKDDKLQIVRFLDQRGAFLTRGTLERVARALHVSRHSIYKYLQQLREARD